MDLAHGRGVTTCQSGVSSSAQCWRKIRAQHGSRASSVCIQNASSQRHGNWRDRPGTKTAAPSLLPCDGSWGGSHLRMEARTGVLAGVGSRTVHSADPLVRRGAGRHEFLGGEWPCDTQVRQVEVGAMRWCRDKRPHRRYLSHQKGVYDTLQNHYG